MPPQFDFVVSAENNYYMAWQAMLFHYSCLKQTGRAPIIVVHGDEPELLPPFQLIAEREGRIQRAPNYRNRGPAYPPRNSAGTLACAKSDADYLVLCDADMVFLRSPHIERFLLAPNQVSFDAVGYLHVLDVNRDMLAKACRLAKVPLTKLENHPVSGGVPHIVPRGLQAPLSHEWLQAMDFFDPPGENLPLVGDSQSRWMISMWAILLAVYRLGLEPKMTELCTSNFDSAELQPQPGKVGPAIVHYCYGDAEFDKRNFSTANDVSTNVWQSRAEKNLANVAVCEQLNQAKSFYEIDRPVVTPEQKQWIVGLAQAGVSPEQVLAAMEAGGWQEEAAFQAIEGTLLGFVAQQAKPVAVPVPEPLLQDFRSTLTAADHPVKVLLSMKRPRLIVLGGLLTDEECDALVALSRPRMMRSMTLEKETGAVLVNEVRTSRGMFFERAENPLIDRIECRIAALVGWPVENGEPLQVLHYAPGEEYKTHYDYFDRTSARSRSARSHSADVPEYARERRLHHVSRRWARCGANQGQRGVLQL